MIISVRGTGGSGKSHLVNRVVSLMGPGQDVAHEGKVVGRQHGSWFVLGVYKTDGSNRGGPDNLGGSLKIRENRWAFLRERAAAGDVLFETLMDAGEVVRTVELAKQHPLHAIFLDTPLDVCLASINARRSARGIAEPVSLKKTTEKFRELQSAMARLKASSRLASVQLLDREAAFKEVCRLVGLAG